jgi:hypothetical protein
VSEKYLMSYRREKRNKNNSTNLFLWFVVIIFYLFSLRCWKCSPFSSPSLVGLDMEMEAPVHTVPASAVRL